jgi:S1-C subfamily serine protease
MTRIIKPIFATLLFFSVVFLVRNQQLANEELKTSFLELEVRCRNSQQSLEKLLLATSRDLTFTLETERKRVIKKAQVNVVHVVAEKNKGSGFFINDQGWILTNCHVVGRSKEVKVMNWKEQWTVAKVLARDPVADIALLEIDVTKLEERAPGATLADSDIVEVGDFIFTLGAPHGKIKTVNGGQVSNNSRYLKGLNILDERSGLHSLYLQVDSGIFPGHSGGPTINMRGEVIGINTRANIKDGAQGYLLPINYVKERLNSLLTSKTKENEYNTVGFELQPRPNAEGVRVSNVMHNSMAHQEGWRDGDLILEMNGRALKLNSTGAIVALRREIAFGERGDLFTFKVKRFSEPGIHKKSLTSYKNSKYETPAPRRRVIEFAPISSQ